MISSESRGDSPHLPTFPMRNLRVQPGEKWFLRFLSDHFCPEYRIGGFLTHWYKGKSRYCPGEGDCPAAVHGSDTSWKGYLSAEYWDDKKKLWYPTCFEISEMLELDMRNVYEPGQVWEITRIPAAKGKTSPVRGKMLEELDPANLPAAYDIIPVLCAVFHDTGVRLYCKNPMPDRVFVAPSEGKAPPHVRAEEEHAAKRAAMGPEISDEIQRRKAELGKRSATNGVIGSIGNPNAGGKR